MKYECHGHIILDGVSYQGAMARHKNGVDEEFLRANLKICADHGISFYRDGGDKYRVSERARKIAWEFGIDYRTPAYIIQKKGYYGSMFGRSFQDMTEYTALVREAKSLGADFIKITVSGMLDFKTGGKVMGPIMDRSDIEEEVKIAKGEGFAVMAHVNGAENIKMALEAGIDSVEHGFWPDSEMIDIMLQTGAIWVPTSVTVKDLIGCGRYDDAVLKKLLEDQKKILVEAYARGVPIASGSDCGAYMVGQGKGTDDEYDFLESIGIDPSRANAMIADRFKRK